MVGFIAEASGGDNEAALAHVGGVRGIYMRGDYLERRRELMAEWTGLLFDGARPPEILLVAPRR